MPKISENPDTLSVGREWYGWCHARGDSEKLSSPGRVFFHHGLLEPTLDSTREATTFSDCDPECPGAAWNDCSFKAVSAQPEGCVCSKNGSLPISSDDIACFSYSNFTSVN